MPYIPSSDRKVLQWNANGPIDVGELTYALTMVIERYRGRKQDSFVYMAEILAALECAKLEFYRRVVAPHEDRRCRENGDVYLQERT